ncbi:uncharacterized protein LOC130378391 isoform X2 [Gadus chalcogrammus]|nr:uncharacterized protein LOC130378391 isoform X2 [Gadus chalcogrammus]
MLDAVGEDVAGGSTEASSSSSQTWSIRQALSGERWRNARPQLLEAMLEAGRVPKGFCQLCNVKEAVISCTDCLPKHMLCSQCDITVHRQYSLHNRSSVVGSSHRALPPTDIFVHDASGEPTLGEEVRLLPFALPKSICSCKAENVSVSGGQKIILVNMNGRYDLSVPLLTCESCKCKWTPQIKDLILNGYWPGTIDFQTVFAIEVFSSFEDLKICAPGLSRHAFVRLLESRSVRAGRVGTVSSENLQKSFLEWTYCRHEIELLLGDDHFSCPACGDDMVAVSLDGNRKMYRFNRKGADESPYFEGTFVAKDTEVEAFVSRIRHQVKTAPGRPSCGKSTFKAGREATRKSEPRLDEEGMMTSVCRHCILFSGLNMFRGEIFAYPLYLQQDLGEKHKIEFVCTDVMCKYYPYVQRVVEKFPELQYVLQMRPFLSVMHAKGHSTRCEVEWSGRNQKGAGLTVGEEVEMVNSYLSRVATTTKYMKKARRTDMITLHARGWNMGKVKVLHRYLAKRYVKSKQRAVAVGEELQNLLTTMQTTQVEMKQWVKEVEEWAASSPKSTNCQDQQGLQRVMEGLVLKIKQRKAELYRDIDNNKDRRPKRDLIAKEKHKLEESIASYNSLVPDTAAVDTADAILSQEFPIWPWDSASTIPLETKKVVFDKTMLLSRLQEEDGILIKEMRNHCRYLTGSSKAVKREIHQIEEDLSKHSSPPPNMSLQAYEGLKCLLQQKLQGLTKRMDEAFTTYRNVLTDPTALQEEIEGIEEMEEEEEGEIPLSLDETDSDDAE